MKTALLLAVICLSAFNIPAQTRPSRGQSSKELKSSHSGLIRQSNRRPESRAAKLTSLADSAKLSQSLPIRRVILYSNGVAYIERRGMVTDHAEVSLSFKQSQVDDVLKSMIVLDLGKGRIGAVSYNSSAPSSARMAEIPFGISASTDGDRGGLAGVLSQLQGARVVVTTGNRVVVGSIITVEARSSQIDAGKPPTTTHRLVVASEKGELSGFDLNEVRSVQLADEGSRRDLNEFAQAAAAARRRDAKTIVVTSNGVGQREMLVSYIIAAPIWKTTYRVVLDSAGKPFFQGWAIVDNVSEEDWNGIQLSLVSGTPISFIQPIQNPVYRYRPVIPLNQELNLRPQTYEPGEGSSGGPTGSLSGKITDPSGSVVSGADVTITNTLTNQAVEVTTDDEGRFSADLVAGRYTLAVSAPGFSKAVVTDLNVIAGLKSTFNLSLEVGNVSAAVTVTAGADYTTHQVLDLSVGGVANGARNVSIGKLIALRESGVEANVQGDEIGDLFEYRIEQPVTVPRDRSALIPILQTNMEGERVSIYTEASSAHRPMSGLLLKNTSALTLEDGSLTVVDGDAYAGEALLERLKPGEDRLVSFALDLGTLVNTEDWNSSQPTFLVKAVNGVVQTYHYRTRRKVYTLVNQTDRERVVFVEHPIDDDADWELTDQTPKPLTKTAKHYRFRVALGPHQKLEFPVNEREERSESFELSKFTRRELELFIARKYVDEPTRAALEKIIAFKDRIAGNDERVKELNKETAEIAQDQQRLRENIKAISSAAPSSSEAKQAFGNEAKQLIARYFSKANEQETRLEQIEKDRRTLLESRIQIQAELDGAIRNLSLDRKL